MNRIAHHRFFLLSATFFGLLFLFMTPPFQVPDEINHFYRACHIAEGHLIAVKEDNRVGGYIPQSVVEISKPFAGIRWNPEAKTSLSTIRTTLAIPLNKDKNVFVDFPNTGLYSPVSYLPQAFIICVFNQLKIGPLFTFYACRIFMLLFWIGSMFYFLKNIPVFRWFFTFLLLLPMSLFINMSISADVVTNMVSVLFIGMVFKFIYSEAKWNRGSLVTILILTFLLASAKMVYVPLVLLLLLIPRDAFKKQAERYILCITAFTVASFTLLFWSRMIGGLYTPFPLYNPAHRFDIGLTETGNMPLQIDFILNHIPTTCIVFIHSFLKGIRMWGPGYIGTFGWLDAHLPIWLIVISYVVLFMILFKEKIEPISITAKQRLIFLTCFVCGTGLLLLSQYLTWDGPGARLIGTLQGRYFIPLFPLVFISFRSFYKNRSGWSVSVVTVVFTVFLLLFSSLVLYNRYFV